MKGRVLVPGEAAGEVLRIEGGLSFWGGVDPRSGRIIASGHARIGSSLAGRILALDRSIGSSSGSSVLLELAATGLAPAGILLGERDLILTLGAVVAAEMGHARMPVLQLDREALRALPSRVRISVDGTIAASP